MAEVEFDKKGTRHRPRLRSEDKAPSGQVASRKWQVQRGLGDGVGLATCYLPLATKIEKKFPISVP